MKKLWMAIVLVICMLAASCSSGETTVESGKLPAVLEAVKTAYGENYIPSMALDETYLSEVVGIPAEDIKNFVAEGPMMSTHIDTFIGIEAEDGKAEEVEQAMQTYLDNQVQNALMYPMNVPKLKATQILRVDQYVFYVCLGAYDEEGLDETAAEQYYTEQVEIGLKAIHDTLGK